MKIQAKVGYFDPAAAQGQFFLKQLQLQVSSPVAPPRTRIPTVHRTCSCACCSPLEDNQGGTPCTVTGGEDQGDATLSSPRQPLTGIATWMQVVPPRGATAGDHLPTPSSISELNQYLFLTSHISSSECRPRGSKLLRTVPLKSVGSCGIILSLVRRSLRPTEQMSKLSISILPHTGSTRGNSELISVDFLLHVLSTTPIIFPAGKVHVIPLRTSGVFGRSLICSEVSILPSRGHEIGGLLSGITAGGKDP